MSSIRYSIWDPNVSDDYELPADKFGPKFSSLSLNVYVVEAQGPVQWERKINFLTRLFFSEKGLVAFVFTPWSRSCRDAIQTRFRSASDLDRRIFGRLDFHDLSDLLEIWFDNGMYKSGVLEIAHTNSSELSQLKIMFDNPERRFLPTQRVSTYISIGEMQQSLLFIPNNRFVDGYLADEFPTGPRAE